MKNIFLLFNCLIVIGCTTVGQQITNRDGTVQVKQQNASVIAANQPRQTNAVTRSSSNSQTLIKNIKPITVSTNFSAPTQVNILQ